MGNAANPGGRNQPNSVQGNTGAGQTQPLESNIQPAMGADQGQQMQQPVTPPPGKGMPKQTTINQQTLEQMRQQRQLNPLGPQAVNPSQMPEYMRQQGGYNQFNPMPQQGGYNQFIFGQQPQQSGYNQFGLQSDPRLAGTDAGRYAPQQGLQVDPARKSMPMQQAMGQQEALDQMQQVMPQPFGLQRNWGRR